MGLENSRSGAETFARPCELSTEGKEKMRVEPADVKTGSSLVSMFLSTRYGDLDLRMGEAQTTCKGLKKFRNK